MAIFSRSAAVPLVRTRAVRCLLVWSALVLPVMVAAAAVLWPWWRQMNALDERITRDRAQLERYQRLLATLPQLRAELDQVKNRDDTRAFYFAAATPTLAGAQLQSEVQEIVRAAGARPVSAQVLPVDEKEQPARIRIRVQFQCTTPALFEVLYRIENARPFLFVEQMSLRSAASDVPVPMFPQPRGGRMPPRSLDDLTVRLDLFGYVLGSSS